MGVMMGGQGMAIQRQLNFGRDAEREADRVGFQIMSEAGFDTSGMVAFFQRMQTASRNYSDLVPAYLLTHPLTTERIADIQARIREQPYKQRLDSLAFYLVRYFEGLMEQDNRQQKTAGQYGMAFAMFKKNDFAAAQRWLDKARATIEAPMPAGVFGMGKRDTAPTVFTSLSLDIKLAQESNQAMIAAALKEATAAHQQFPLSRGIAHQYAEAMIASGQLEEAARFLREQAQFYKDEPEVHDLLAKAYSKQGKMALQHMALAESYTLQGGTLAALDQLNLARKSKDASFYDQAQIDARERELKQRRKDAMGDKYKEP
jgi:predicted Zn-dependent protease